MPKVTVIGLGLMGSALARAMRRAGHDLSVWNRTPAAMQPFAAQGVDTVTDIAAAISASPVIVICIDTYASTCSLLTGPGIPALLAGRTVVQLTTGSPKEAASLQAWITAQGAHYLDGAILCGPSDIDRHTGEILLCGDPAAHTASAPVTVSLAGSVRHFGPNIRAAATLDLAWLTIWYGQFAATIHAAAMCEAEGVSLTDFIALFPDNASVQQDATVIRDQTFGAYSASLAVWGAALERVCQQADDAGINRAIPDFFAGYFRKAVSAGYGDQHHMAMFKLLQAAPARGGA